MVNGRPLWQALMAVWFILWGLLAVTNFQFAASAVILGILAIAAGVCWFGKIGGA
jgi:hypothetical protein